ncbi:MAG: tetratricopeptide repeat protein [Bacteroidales bacterium]
MKKYITSLLLVFVSIIPGLAGTETDSLFQKANAYYAQGNYTEAIDVYENILAGGMESGGLFYNLGNAYYKIQNYPKAILNYEKALLYNPRDEDIIHNLAKARLFIIDKIEEIPEFIIKRWINSLIILFSSDTWAILSLITFVVGLLTLLLYFLSSTISVRKVGFYSGLITLVFSLIFFYLSFKARILVEDSDGGIVMTPTVTVKGSPRESGTDLFIIHEGTKVVLLDSLDSWYEIRLADGKQGWMQQKNVEPI